VISAVELADLQFVAASADAGNFAAAAKTLGLYPSTVSRRVSRFEDELGLTLFERGQFGVRLTAGGRAVMVHIRRALGDIDAVRRSGQCNARGEVGQIRLGVRMPPVDPVIRDLLSEWHQVHPTVDLSLLEMNEREMSVALEERWLDAALVPRHILWPRAVSVPIYRERLYAAIPVSHVLTSAEAVKWSDLRSEAILLDDCSSSALFLTLLGDGGSRCTHAASKQSVLVLVSAGFGVMLTAESHTHVPCPGVVFKRIEEANAWMDIDLAWVPRSEEAALGRFVAFMRDAARSRLFVGHG
jgi:DNA-binding transcriptional LysR family regulator